MNDLSEEFAILQVPFSEQELKRIELAAQAEGISIEEWLREQLLRAVQQEPEQDD